MDEKSQPSDAGNGKASDNLNPLTDEGAEELFFRALEEAGCPREITRKLRAGEDPRARLQLSDGSEVRVEYVPLPDQKEAREAFVRLCAEEMGVPINRNRRARFLEEFEQLSIDLADAVRAAAWNQEVGKQVDEALADAPDPSEERTWNQWAKQVWDTIRSALGGPLWREVMGEGARKGEGEVHVDLDADDTPALPDPRDRTRRDVDDFLDAAEEARLIAKAGLTPAEREVWTLSRAGLSPAEIADIRDTEPETVSVQKSRAKAKLKKAAST